MQEIMDLLEQYAIHPDIEDGGLIFSWYEITADGTELLFTAEIGDAGAMISDHTDGAENDDWISYLPRDCYSSDEQMIRALLTEAATQYGLEPSGYWQCERSDFWQSVYMIGAE